MVLAVFYRFFWSRTPQGGSFHNRPCVAAPSLKGVRHKPLGGEQACSPAGLPVIRHHPLRAFAGLFHSLFSVKDLSL